MGDAPGRAGCRSARGGDAPERAGCRSRAWVTLWGVPAGVRNLRGRDPRLADRRPGPGTGRMSGDPGRRRTPVHLNAGWMSVGRSPTAGYRARPGPTRLRTRGGWCRMAQFARFYSAIGHPIRVHSLTQGSRAPHSSLGVPASGCEHRNPAYTQAISVPRGARRRRRRDHAGRRRPPPGGRARYPLHVGGPDSGISAGRPRAQSTRLLPGKTPDQGFAPT